MVYVVAGAAITPFHGDESTQVYMSRDYAYQFIQRDLNLVLYHEPPISAQEQFLRLINGTVNKYLIGLGWHVGGFTLADINEQWDWGASWEYNTTTNHAPSPALLQVARIPSALLLALGVPVMFALGWLTGGRWAAVTASLLYALHPALLINGRRAMMEGSLTFFSLLTVLAGAWWVKRRGWNAALALGIAAGLTVASKHTGVFTVISVFGALGISLFLPLAPRPVDRGVGATQRGRPVQRTGTLPRPYNAQSDGLRVRQIVQTDAPLRVPTEWVQSVVRLIAAGVLALMVFYALNPAWWGDPVSRAGEVLTLRQDLLQGQNDAFGGYTSATESAAGFLRQVFVTTPQYFEIDAWGDFLADSIRVYEASIWHGFHVGAVILVPLIVIGVIYLLRKTQRPLRLLIGMWALVILLSVWFLTPLEWQRYYLPAYPPILLLASLGVAGLVDWVKARR